MGCVFTPISLIIQLIYTSGYIEEVLFPIISVIVNVLNIQYNSVADQAFENDGGTLM